MNPLQRITSVSGFKAELLANFAGTGWSAVMQLVLVPLYIKFMGIEAYGLVGFYLMLQAMLQVLDLGLSPTMNREMARYSVQPEKAAEARDLVRTLEAGNWLTAIVIGVGIMAAAPWIATRWLKASALPTSTIRQALMFMGLLAAFQWPVSFYRGGLMGLRRQVLFNALKVATVTASYGGAALILWLVSPTIIAFFAWQAAMGAAQALLVAAFLWRSLPPSDRRPRFDLTLIRGVWRFAAGVSGIMLAGLILTQIDKVILSKLLVLKMFGYYTLAWVVANGLWVITGSVFNVVFPRLSALVAASDEVELKQSYHRASQLMAVLVLPAAAVLSLFSFEVVRLWTRSGDTALHTAPIVSILVIGSAINGILLLPFALQLAYGWTRLNLSAGVICIALAVPAIFLLATRYGAVGAAAVWAGLNILNLLIVVPLMHRRLLKGELWQYYGDVGFPLFGAALIATMGRAVFVPMASSILELVFLFGVWLSTLLAAVLAAPLIRARVLTYVTKQKLLYTQGTGTLLQ
jgi:O-antigen/teichoic acid export membrane protein